MQRTWPRKLARPAGCSKGSHCLPLHLSTRHEYPSCLAIWVRHCDAARRPGSHVRAGRLGTVGVDRRWRGTPIGTGVFDCKLLARLGVKSEPSSRSAVPRNASLQTVTSTSDRLLAHHPAAAGTVTAGLGTACHGFVVPEGLAARRTRVADLGACRALRLVLGRMPEHRVRGRLAHLGTVQQQRKVRSGHVGAATVDAVLSCGQAHAVRAEAVGDALLKRHSAPRHTGHRRDRGRQLLGGGTPVCECAGRCACEG